MSFKNYRNMFDLIDDIFNDAYYGAATGSVQPVRFNKNISSQSFPPTNILIDQKTKIMTIQSALAGIHEDWINLSFDGDSLNLIVNVPKNEEKKEETQNYYFQIGLKKIESLKTSWNVDPRYFDREKVEVKFDNGLLTITIPPREEVAPKKIPIFGNLKLEDLTKKEEE